LKLTNFSFLLALACVLVIAPEPGKAQSTNPQSQPAKAGTASSSQGAHKENDSLGFLLRRIQFLSADGISHFRYMDSGPGKVTARDDYYKISTRVQINLRADGNTYLQARGESGRAFNASYDYTGIGMHDHYWSYNLKSLFLGQKIGKHLEAQVGGIEFDRGAGSEATYADNDAWLEGYRLSYSGLRNKSLPDKVSVTVGYVGDFLQPNFFARASRMGEENYVQVLAQKKLGENRDLSAEYTSLQAIRYARQAFRWQKMPVPVVKDLSLEAITRASDDPTFGWYGSLGRTLPVKLPIRTGVFYSDMPKSMFLQGTSQVFLNGDRYVPGKRLGPTVSVTPFRNFEVSLWGGKRLDNTAGTRYRGEIAVRYQMASLLNRLMR
jgi:hypothetical protein